jgi:hypothetical protein
MGDFRGIGSVFATNANIDPVASELDDLVVCIKAFLDSTWDNAELKRVHIESDVLEALLLQAAVDLVIDQYLVLLLSVSCIKWRAALTTFCGRSFIAELPRNNLQHCAIFAT